MRLKFSDTFEIGTSIKSVEVPKELLARHLSGVDWIDDGLGGEGFTPSMVTMFTGEPGAGKTTALLTVASGLAERGALVLFNTAEESLFQLKRTVNRLGIRGDFMVGGESNVDTIIAAADKIRSRGANKDRPFFLVIDSLQCLDDGAFSTGRITSATAERSLEKLTTWAKEGFTNVIAIGQVTKGGQFAGSNKMKHMIDCHMHLSWERKDKELLGLRKFEVQKNRFGGTGRTSWLSLGARGFAVEHISDAS